MIVKFKRVHPSAQLPEKKHEDDACFDLYSCESLVLKPGEFIGIETGIQMEIPIGTEATIRPRSGLAVRHGITVLNTPGTIDAGYRGNIKVILINHSGKQYSISVGDRIAQMKIERVHDTRIFEVVQLDETERGAKGFGSTGY
ncbi:MAG: dUTP diphosphatase [Candidatus Lokiarchaeota archaeon]|nr:dUTP diphosphatase [Candidatus Lokiarchaeota archaeon]